MGAMTFLAFASLLLGIISCVYRRRMPKLWRWLLPLAVAVAGWLASASVLEVFVDPPSSWVLLGALSGVIAVLAAPKGAWWFGPVPVVIVYGFGTVAGAVIWHNEGVKEMVRLQAFTGFLGGLAAEMVRQVVANRTKP